MVYHFLLQPSLYSTLVTVALAFYLVWVLARQRYLGVFQQFNALALSLLAGLIGIVISQIFYPGFLDIPHSYHQAIAYIVQLPTLTALLIGYSLAILVAWRYITTIHYPWWRVMDSIALGLSLVELGWAVGILFSTPSIIVAVAVALLAVFFLGLLALHQKIEQPGFVAGAHVLTLFSLGLAFQYSLVSWQGVNTSVEYLAGGLGIGVGLIVLGVRFRHKVPHTTLAPLPAGVSQKFRETFARALTPKRPSPKDGSSHN